MDHVCQEGLSLLQLQRQHRLLLQQDLKMSLNCFWGNSSIKWCIDYENYNHLNISDGEYKIVTVAMSLISTMNFSWTNLTRAERVRDVKVNSQLSLQAQLKPGQDSFKDQLKPAWPKRFINKKDEFECWAL